MPTKTGHIHWNELNTTDPEAAAAFYKTVLGWDIVPVAEGETKGWLIRKDGDTVGGAFSLQGPGFEGMPSHWFTYVAVADVDAALAETERAGGTVMRPAITIPSAGRFGVIKDPTGAFLGLIEPEGGVA